MVQPNSQKQKKGKSKSLAQRLPRLGRMSQLLLLVGISAIIIIVLWVVYQQQVPRRAELQETLITLQRAQATTPKQQASKESLMAQIRSIEAEPEVAGMLFSTTDQSPEILDKLLETALLYDIDVTGTKQSTSEQTMTISKKKIKFQLLTYDLDLRGQVTDFQNFLLALDDKLPTSQISQVNISVADTEGEQDRASVTVDVFCYESE